MFDAWSGLGNSGWSWKQIAPYFRKFHTLHAPSEAVAKAHGIDWIDEQVRGTDGPIQASFCAMEQDPIGQAWADSFKSLGHELSTDPFGGQGLGPWSQISSIDPVSVTRSYSASGYYRPIMNSRPNLTVLTNATVHKTTTIAEAGSHIASGVLVQLPGSETPQEIHAAREVILAAGAFQTPKLLELSGIGDAKILKEYGIACVSDLPLVGENLQDHLMTGISYEAADGIPTGDPLIRQEPEMMQMVMQMYQEHKAGPLAMGSLANFSYMPILEDFVSTPDDFQSLVQKYKPGPTATRLEQAEFDYVLSVLQKPSEGSAALFMLMAQVNLHNGPKQVGMVSDAKPGNYLSIGAGLSHPLSRGSSHLSSSDPNASPTIDPRYLSHPLDIEVYARHMLAVEKLAATPPLANFIKQDGKRAQPGNPKLTSVSEAKAYIRETALTNNHPVGTAAMLPKELGGVVDERLRVYGIKGLRVVDASVMPLIPRGNTQTAVYAVAEKAADLLKEDNGLSL